MTVARILANKGRSVVTVPAARDAAGRRRRARGQAHRRPDRRRRGRRDGRIVSERDVVRALARRGVDALEHPCPTI